MKNVPTLSGNTIWNGSSHGVHYSIVKLMCVTLWCDYMCKYDLAVHTNKLSRGDQMQIMNGISENEKQVRNNRFNDENM